jgi:2-polyprenyl-3-methyl-5-hydroxy-6-metoxy-1,4-benzoquinol methylase
MPLLSNSLARARLSRVQKYLGKRILDVGCGHAEILNYLPAGVELIVLLDRNPQRQGKIKARVAQTKIQVKLLIEDIEQSQFDLSLTSFDTVVMAALLEHLKDPKVALKNIHSVMTTEGKLIVTTPSPLGGKLHRLGSHLGLVFAEAAHEHVRFYNGLALRSLMLESGFLVEHYERFLLGLNQLVVARKI